MVTTTRETFPAPPPPPDEFVIRMSVKEATLLAQVLSCVNGVYGELASRGPVTYTDVFGLMRTLRDSIESHLHTGG